MNSVMAAKPARHLMSRVCVCAYDGHRSHSLTPQSVGGIDGC